MERSRPVNLTPEQFEALAKRVEARSLREEDFETIKAVAESTLTLMRLVKDNKIPDSDQLRELLVIRAKGTNQ